MPWITNFRHRDFAGASTITTYSMKSELQVDNRRNHETSHFHHVTRPSTSETSVAGNIMRCVFALQRVPSFNYLLPGNCVQSPHADLSGFMDIA
jgi:hypothetical protein